MVLGEGGRELREVPLPNLQVAVFLVDSSRPAASAGGYVQPHSGQHMWPMFCHSVIRQHPEARFAVLTTPESRLPDLPFGTDIFARPIGSRPLLYERMKHYVSFLEEGSDERSYLFLESDMLMLNRLQVEIREDWDLAIAYKSTGMWINSGMLLVRPHRRGSAITFLRRALRFYEDRHLSHPKWGADQAALRDAVGLTEPPGQPRVQVTEGARVLLLPRAGFTPFASRMAALKPPPTWILHFSGKRKKQMSGFYWLHFGSGAPIGRVLSRLTPRPRRSAGTRATDPSGASA